MTQLPGTEFGILLHDRRLRETLVSESDKGVGSAGTVNRFRLLVGRALRSLAAQIQPGPHEWGMPVTVVPQRQASAQPITRW